MPTLPDLNDPRYLHEIGWFLYHEKYERDHYGGSYDDERLAYSRLLLEEVLQLSGHDTKWLEDKTIVSIGSGCTGDLAAWPAAAKVSIDPLLRIYQQLGMLLNDEENTKPTVYLSSSAEAIPLVDGTVDVVVCRNALDHMPEPQPPLNEFCRILRDDGKLFLSVDLGGEPTPDEPTVFSQESLSTLILSKFDIVAQSSNLPAHSKGRDSSVRIVARKKSPTTPCLDKEAILKMYIRDISQDDANAAAGVARPARPGTSKTP